jgi:8-oxo-dGTP diphosphatase
VPDIVHSAKIGVSGGTAETGIRFELPDKQQHTASFLPVMDVPLSGGKIEPGEAPQQALKREIEEELDTEIAVHDKIGTIEYDYPTFHLSMDCFWCTVVSGELILKEAEAACWLTKDELDSVQWLPADQTILEKIREMMK